MSEHYYLLLKWGTLKGWSVPDELLPMLEKYFSDGVPMSCITDSPSDERKKILCDLIDAFKGPITNDWTGKTMTKKQAKKYVTEHDNQ